MPAQPIMAPTDRSIPPVRTTKVMPMASRPLMEAIRSRFRMLLGDRY